MDKADYSQTEKWYYAAVIGQVKSPHSLTGVMLETPSWWANQPQSILERTVNTTIGFLAMLEPVQPN